MCASLWIDRFIIMWQLCSTSILTWRLASKGSVALCACVRVCVCVCVCVYLLDFSKIISLISSYSVTSAERKQRDTGLFVAAQELACVFWSELLSLGQYRDCGLRAWRPGFIRRRMGFWSSSPPPNRLRAHPVPLSSGYLGTPPTE